MHRLCFALLLPALAACMHIPTPAERQLAADALAAQQGWSRQAIHADDFQLTSYLPDHPDHAGADTLTVFIEGDGFAWRTRRHPSADPTPLDPVALRLALAHPTGPAAYLARPCQYGQAVSAPCSVRYWTDARFAPRVIDASNAAIDTLKRHFGVSHVQLVGYSGGAAVAVLAAARRDDVTAIITVAGNLDIELWARHHRIPRLTRSLNPADVAHQLQNTPHYHFVGARDTIVPVSVIAAFVDGSRPGSRVRLRVVDDFDHRCCWVEAWPDLLDEIE